MKLNQRANSRVVKSRGEADVKMLERSTRTAVLAVVLSLAACGPNAPPQTAEETRTAAAEGAKQEAEARMDATFKKEQAAKREQEKPQ